MEELVVLVDEQNNPVGTAPKATVHTTDTPLHRGFSLFLFNSKKQLLVTKRAASKKTFPGVWTNTVCGHPAPDEEPADATRRRLNTELGIMNNEIKDIRVVAPYRYRFADAHGVVENEVCPVLVGYADVDPKPNPEEIDSWKWMDWDAFLRDIAERPDVYSPWCREEARLLSSRAERGDLLLESCP